VILCVTAKSQEAQQVEGKQELPDEQVMECIERSADEILINAAKLIPACVNETDLDIKPNKELSLESEVKNREGSKKSRVEILARELPAAKEEIKQNTSSH